MLHKSLRYKIEMFHNLEPACCVRWPTNLTDLMHHYKPEEQGPNVGKTNHGGTWHVPSPCLLCLCLLTAYILEILVKHDSGQDLWFICVHFETLTFCVSAQRITTSIFFKWKRIEQKSEGTRFMELFCEDYLRMFHHPSPPPLSATHTQYGSGKYHSYCGLWIRVWKILVWIIFIKKVPSNQQIKTPPRASLVVQWLGVCLPMQGTRVRALVWEDPTCHGAAGPVSHDCWACASGACAPQQGRLRWWEAHAPQWRVAPACHSWRGPLHGNEDPTQP